MEALLAYGPSATASSLLPRRARLTFTKRPQVLVVDDSLEVRKILKQMLEFEGYEVLEAENGKIAVDFVKWNPQICLVLLDLGLPNGDGKYFLKKTRYLKKSRLFRVCIHSARSDFETVKKCLDSGADAYVVKGVDYEILSYKLRVLLSPEQVESSEFPSMTCRFHGKLEWDNGRENVDIINISEVCMSLKTKTFLPVGKKLRLNSNMIAEIIGRKKHPVFLRVVHSEKQNQGTNLICTFEGLSEKEVFRLSEVVSEGKLPMNNPFHFLACVN